MSGRKAPVWSGWAAVITYLLAGSPGRRKRPASSQGAWAVGGGDAVRNDMRDGVGTKGARAVTTAPATSFPSGRRTTPSRAATAVGAPPPPPSAAKKRGSPDQRPPGSPPPGDGGRPGVTATSTTTARVAT